MTNNSSSQTNNKSSNGNGNKINGNKSAKRRRTQKEETIKFISLGGVGEIGKNMYVVEFKDEILVIDGGLKFPEEDMLGIDLVIPDFTYLTDNLDKVKAILLTHGHEDHIGGLPYILKYVNKPVYGTKLTLGLLENKLREHNILNSVNLNVIQPNSTIEIGKNFKVEFFRVNHSIPDSVGMAITTPVGTILHTGDFKIDQTPVDGQITDFQRISEISRKGVLALFADCTNAERPGFTMSERVVGNTIDEIFRLAKSRIIIATFASNVHRIQQVLDAAYKYNKKVCINGRSMINVVNTAMELGYLNVPKGMLIELDDLDAYNYDQIVMITTGSQGEPMSALTRMANSEHRKVEIAPGDTVVIAASPIPGNEKLVSKTINNLFKRGADVVYESVSGIHVSGHASQEELKMMINLVRPKYLVPIHGEYRHCIHLAKIGETLGISRENIFTIEIGDVLEIGKEKAKITGSVPSGYILIDGLGVGDVGNIVLRDRKQLSLDGILVVVVTLQKGTNKIIAGPDIVSRGFVYVRESEQLIEEAKAIVSQSLEKCRDRNIKEWAQLKQAIRDQLGKSLYEKTRRKPMILPIIMEV
ncbi:ribonuclease J [Anaerobranca californiensis DSM 14826]|uniref:Ribonuclease J n=1 Tax=Anaerobranca californiensis DSM 14826 TaxID=1120989 RepID=A0A1M6KD26_9FIRM|nr:ribonuclease J [Anaerobranca californiensis]SHJ56846.1 ribonuclease J [Anaerobranca californiensis DSM 14826]